MNTTNCTIKGISCQRLQLIRIEALVLFGIAALFLLLVLGSYRRRSSHQAVKFIVWGAYTISFILVGYTIGLMQSFHWGNSLFSVWALCMALILGSVDSLSAYSLDDNDNWKRFYAQYLGYHVSVGWLLGTYGADSNLQGPMWAIYAIAALSITTRTTSFQAASKSYDLSDSTKWVADYMSYEHEQEDALVPNPVTMHGYRYVVAEEDVPMYKPEPPDYLVKYKADAIKLVTVEQIWQCSGRFGSAVGDLAVQWEIDLPNEVRQAVINSFVRSSGRLTNGITSLNVNQVEQLLWTCNGVRTVTHTILIWHIATTLCHHTLNGGGDGRQPSDEDEMETHASVASSLSKYCAYLVAFAPNLLPDHSFDSATIFDALVDEATELLKKGTMSMQQRYDTLMSLGADQEDKRLIVMGARLGMQLVDEITDPRLRWKVLHDFWAEMMLYIAPSKDTRAHLETLTRGGEFITHLWALLTHAGILERDYSAGTP